MLPVPCSLLLTPPLPESASPMVTSILHTPYPLTPAQGLVTPASQRHVTVLACSMGKPSLSLVSKVPTLSQHPAPDILASPSQCPFRAAFFCSPPEVSAPLVPHFPGVPSLIPSSSQLLCCCFEFPVLSLYLCPGLQTLGGLHLGDPQVPQAQDISPIIYDSLLSSPLKK
jgi:hypothetical protein